MALTDTNINETMAADWEAIREKFAVEEPETLEKVEAPAEPAQEPANTTARARNEDGTFAPKSKDDPEPEGNKPPVESTPELHSQPATTGVADVNKPPATWKPTARAEWEKLSPAIKAEVHRREADFMNGHRQLMPDAQLGKSMREVVAPYKALIDAEAGGRPELAFGELLKTAAILRMGTPQQKLQVVLGVAKQYGVDLSQAQPASSAVQPGSTPQPLQDPRVDQILQQMNFERQQAANREQQALESAVNTWMQQADEKGQPTHPYLGDVASEMSALVPQIRQEKPSLDHNQVLQEAYERATWGNPEIRTLLLAQQAQGKEQVRVADNQTRVREAKRAASVNVPRRASTPSSGKPGTIDQTLEATARELGLIS